MFAVTDNTSWQSISNCWISQSLYFRSGPGDSHSFTMHSVKYTVGEDTNLLVSQKGGVFVGGEFHQGSNSEVVPLSEQPSGSQSVQ